MDEMFVPAYPLQTIADVLSDRVFRKVASAVFPRLLYGPDGHATPPNATMFASYLRHVNPCVNTKTSSTCCRMIVSGL